MRLLAGCTRQWCVPSGLSILRTAEADLESEKHAAEANLQKLEELVAGIEATNHRRKLQTLEAESQIRSCLWILGAFAGVCLAACKLTLTALVCKELECLLVQTA